MLRLEVKDEAFIALLLVLIFLWFMKINERGNVDGSLLH